MLLFVLIVMTAASVKAQSCSQCGRHTRINSKIHLDGAIATLTGLAPACSSGGCPGPTEGPGFRVQPNEVVYGEKQTITLSISPLNLCNGGGASVELSSCGGDLFYIKKPGDAYWTISSTVLNAYRRDQSQCPGGPGGPGGGTGVPCVCGHVGCIHTGDELCQCDEGQTITNKYFSGYEKYPTTTSSVSESNYLDANGKVDNVAVTEALNAMGNDPDCLGTAPPTNGVYTFTFIDRAGTRIYVAQDSKTNLTIPATDEPFFAGWVGEYELTETTYPYQCSACNFTANQVGTPPASGTSTSQAIGNLTDTVELIVWPLGSSSQADPGNSVPVGPSSSDSSDARVTINIGMGRKDNGDAAGLLSFNAKLDDSNPLAPGNLKLYNPFEEAGYSTVNTLTNTRRFESPGAIAIEESVSNQLVCAVYSKAQDGTPGTLVAKHTLEKVTDTGGSGLPGVKYTVEESGLTQTTYYYGSTPAPGSKSWKEVAADGTIRSGYDLTAGGQVESMSETGQRVGTQDIVTSREISNWQNGKLIQSKILATQAQNGLPEVWLTTSYAYYDATDEAQLRAQYSLAASKEVRATGKLKWQINPDGSWIRYDYHPESGDLLRTLRPWLSTVTNPAQATFQNSQAITYQIISKTEIWEIESIQGHVISRTWRSEWEDDIHPVATATRWAVPSRQSADPSLHFQQVWTSYQQGENAPWYLASPKNVQGNGNPDPNLNPFNGSFKTQQTQRFTADYTAWTGSMTLHDQGLQGRLRCTLDASGQVTAYTYAGGDYDSVAETFTWDGRNSYNGPLKTTSRRYAVDPDTLILDPQTPMDPVYQVTEQDDQGLTRHERTFYVDQSTGQETQTSLTTHDYDPNTRRRLTTIQDGVTTYATTRTVVSNTEHLTETDAAGNSALTVTSSDGEVLRTEKIGAPGKPNIITSLVRNGLTETSTVASGNLRRITSSTQDCAGRTISTTSENGFESRTSYELGGRKVNEHITAPSWTVTERHLDGRIKKITSDRVPTEYHTYTVNPGDGSMTETIHYEYENGPRWRKTTTNGLGWVLREEEPPVPGSNVSRLTTHSYNAKGQRTKTTRTGLADELFVYDAFGRVKAHGHDFNHNGLLDSSGSDPITVNSTSYELTGSVWWEVTSTAEFLSETEVQPLFSAKVVKRSLAGLGSAALETAISSDGTQTTTLRSVDVASRTVITTLSSNRAANPVIRTETAGLLVSEINPSASAPTTYTYDELERVVTVREPSGIKRRFAYNDSAIEGSLMRAGSHVSTEWRTPIPTSTVPTPPEELLVERVFQPVAYSGEEKLYLETLYVANNLPPRTTTFNYRPDGQLFMQTGAGAYPVMYEYDEYNQLFKMYTFRTWIDSSNHDPGDITTWTRDPATGLLLSKTDALSAPTTYSYHSNGLLKKRQTARGAGATYGYDPAGRLLTTVYSGVPTPNVTRSYYRNGALKTVRDAAGLHTHLPRELTGGGEVKEVISESGLNLNGTIHQPHNALGLRTGWSLSAELPGTEAAAVSYEQQAQTGLLASVSLAGGLGTWDYARDAVSGRLTGMTAPGTGVSRSYDSRGNIETIRYGPAAPAAPLLGWLYQYHLNGQRKQMRSTVPNHPGYLYGYGGRGELGSTSKFSWNANMTSTAAVSGQLRSYQYDAQGNRLSVTRNLAVQWNTIIGGLVRDDYGLNAANQYVSIAHSPPAVEISGMRAVPGSRVTVNNLPVPMPGLHTNATMNESYQRNGEPGGFMYWLAHDAQANGVLNYWPQVTVKTYNDSVTPPALVDAVSGRAYLRPAQETLVHDADGNLTQDACWTYQWDGEGRMSGCQMRDVGLPLDVPLLRLAYVYDAQGRRAAKRVFAREINAAGTGREATERLRSDWRYWYDGWNLMVEKDLVSGLVRQYVWGLDLSGSLGGAGGVGGLLGVRVGGKTYTACTETNGNIMGLIDGTTGVLAARWDYEAFGITTTTVEAAGPFGHELCPFRFSSKYRDVETGLYYYGYRYYSPETGRWPSRDPLGDQVFLKERMKEVPQTIRERLAREGLGPLYQFVGNDPVNRWDWLGLAVISSISVSYESGYPMTNLQAHPFWSQIFGEVDGHKPTGYVYAGYMTVYGEDGKVLLTMPVLTGGYKTIGSTVPDGGDSAVPSGSYSVETKPSGGTQGYLVSPTGDRKLIKIHYGNISAGCIVTVHGSWSEFVKHMADTNKCKETVPLNTSKQF